MGKRIFGLDLGTNSIGWGVVDDLGNGQFELIKRGVHVFQEAINKDSKGTESSKAAERTKYRSARKLKYRRKLRKIETLKVLSEEGLCPRLEMSELNAWRYDRKYPENKAFRDWWKTTDPKEGKGEFNNPYYLRWLVSTEKLDLDVEGERHKLGRALYHLAQRRGFKSNRLDAASEDEKGDLRDRMLSILEEEDFQDLDDLMVVFDGLSEGVENQDAVKFHKITIKGLNREKDLESAHAFLLKHLNKKENLGKVKKGIAKLDEEIEEHGCKTLGQLFWTKYYRQGERIRNQYTSREGHYETEFEIICKMQGVPDELRKKLYDAIFYQRALKSQKGLVANCPFEHDVPREAKDGATIMVSKKRAPISHPLFEEFRMWQTLSNIKIQPWVESKLRPLSFDEKALVIPKFYRAKASFDFCDIASVLTPKNQEFGYVGDKDSNAHVKFNYRIDQSIAGCPFTAALMRIFGKGDYKSAIFDAYRGKKEKSVDKKSMAKTPEDVVNEVWHVLFSYNKPEKLRSYAVSKLGLSEKSAATFSKIRPKQGYGSLSLTAMRRILPWLKKGYIYSHAVFTANLPCVIGAKVEDHPKLEENIRKLIDTHDRYQKAIKLANHFIELGRKNPEVVQDIEYWISSGWNKWCHQVREVSFLLFGIKQWEALEDVGQEALSLETRDMLNGLKEQEEPFVNSLTIDARIKSHLLEWAAEHGKREQVESRLDRLYHPSKEEAYEPILGENGNPILLGNPEISSIRNPVFNRAMHRLKAVVNELLRTGKIKANTVVHLEMAREMNDANKRVALRRWNEKRRKLREYYKEKIEEVLLGMGEHREASGDEVLKYQLAMEQNIHGTGLVRVEVRDSDMLKYQLWEEQNHICLYTGKTISITDFIGKDPQFDIEHTIPRSKSCDNSQENKTLCELAYNRNVKKNRLPFDCDNHEEIIPRIAHWKRRIEDLDHLINVKKRATRNASDKDAKDRIIQDRLVLQFERDYLREKYRRFTMEDAPEGFKNSQLVDTRIITKYGSSLL